MATENIRREIVYHAIGRIDSNGVTVREGAIVSSLPSEKQRAYTLAIQSSYEGLVVSLRCSREVIPFEVTFYKQESPPSSLDRPVDPSLCI